MALRSSSGGAILIPQDGDPAPILFAPQGGFIVLAGIRASGFDECVDLTAAIRDQENGGAVVALEQRPNQLEDGGDGWFYPHLPMELFNWANLPACPFGVLDRDFHGEPWLFEMVVTDGVSTSTASRTLVPTCAFDDTYCIQSCTLGTSMTLAR